MNTTTLLRSIIGWGILVCMLFSACQPTDDSPRKIEILFLGHDSDHHDSYHYAPVLAGALSKKGINISYTDKLEDLNDEKLSDYDGLIIYANHDSISPSQEKAMLSFVKNGKGLIPIHCASYCFRNSDEYVKLVGAQFKSHETGTFTAEIIKTDHPITQGLKPFETWDETYVHALHTNDRTILMERVEGDHREPWTWTKTYGKGRMFYTAYGHDERTWNNPGFHDLMERGILWAVGDKVKANWAKLTMPVHQYSAKSTIPNYEQRNPAPQLQAPFTQPESEKLIQIPPGFELKLFASEPDIVNPIAMTWDEKGRLWVVETVDYPNEVRDNSQGDDRIKICEDTDGDGKADKFTVFADGLNIPTSIVRMNDGVIISMAPDFVFLKDTTGDDVADVKEVLITGWGTSDTHAGPSNLKYGFDNHIWGTVGYSGFKGTVGGVPFEFAQNFYRFTPTASALEVLTSTSNNTWGLGFSETFDVFGSTANNAHSWYMAIPDRYFKGVGGISPLGSKKISAYYDFHPITPNFRQVDVFGGFTAAAGHNLYTARAFPKEYWNRIALVCEPTGHLLAQGVLEKDGAGFSTKDGWNLMASADEWVSPVHAEVGPDGAVWVSDWYNFIIQHNPTPRADRGGYQAENGKGNAHINPLRDRKHGRIYRIVHKNASVDRTFSLDKSDPNGLIRALQNDNMFWRLNAQRLLVERGEKDILPELYRLILDHTVDEIGLNGPAVHALWTLHGLGAFTPENEKALEVGLSALSHQAAGVRKAALQVLPRTEEVLAAFIQESSLKDSDLHTRLAALLAFSEMAPNKEAGMALYEASQVEENIQDVWLSRALYIAAFKHAEGFQSAFPAELAAMVPQTNQGNNTNKQTFDFDQAVAEASSWKTMTLPGLWEDRGLPDFDGEVWFYKSVEIPRRGSARLSLGPIDDTDITWVNGKVIGEIRDKYDEPRSYPLNWSSLKDGTNHLLIQVEDYRGGGGFSASAKEFFLTLRGDTISLAGEWKYKVVERYNLDPNSTPFDGSKSMALLVARTFRYGQAESDEPIVDDPNALQLNLKTVKGMMGYDKKELVVEAGQSVVITFENTDLLQHNVLIVKPGSLETVGNAADALAREADGMDRAYIPNIPEVLYSSGLVDPNTAVKIRFTAPTEPGDYPFVCTFPGHWRMMNGVLKVKKKPI